MGASGRSTLPAALPAASNKPGAYPPGLSGRCLVEHGVMARSHGRQSGGPPCFCLNRHGWNRVRLLGWIGSEAGAGELAVGCAAVDGPG